MRSIYLILFDTSVKLVEHHLDQRHPRCGDRWLLNAREGDPVLYIGLDPIESVLVSPEEQLRILDAAGGRTFSLVTVDVSGRHPGNDEVRALIEELLAAFDGLVFDDYTDHPWSLHEIRVNVHKDGHPFFDYTGWYDDKRSGG
ncbi:MAG TPA: hypothetical protein VG269_25590 [Tepidisphaeraceae bacterium]|jgi:hypothetical protein|nr:hypothetical protein [Tepidisphaeraceae bacterium]